MQYLSPLFSSPQLSFLCCFCLLLFRSWFSSLNNLLCSNLPSLNSLCSCLLPHSVCVFVCVSGGLWQGIDRSHSWVNSAYAPGGSRSVLRRNPNSSCELKQVPNPFTSSSPLPPPPPSCTASHQFSRVISYLHCICVCLALSPLASAHLSPLFIYSLYILSAA